MSSVLCKHRPPSTRSSPCNGVTPACLRCGRASASRWGRYGSKSMGADRRSPARFPIAAATSRSRAVWRSARRLRPGSMRPSARARGSVATAPTRSPRHCLSSGRLTARAVTGWRGRGRDVSRRRRRPHPPHARGSGVVSGVGSSAVHAAARPRFGAIDGLRGLAICLMVVYHFAFDLAWFRVIRADFNNDLFWLGARAVIASLFLGLVGVSLVLARRAHPGTRPFWRRVMLIAGCAVLVSIASYLTFPQTFITFGILHCIAFSSVIARPLIAFPRVALMAGIAIVALGATVQLPWLDAPWLNWIGMMTHKPPTEDYVPLFPWLGVVLIGIALAHALVRDQRHLAAASRLTPRWLAI